MTGVAEVGLSVAVYNLLEKILKAVREVVRLKNKCQKLAKICLRLRMVLDAHPKALAESSIASDLHSSLETALAFVKQCTERWNFLHKGWEVSWQKRLPGLESDLSSLVGDLMLESILAQRQDLQTSAQHLDGLEASLAELALSNASARDDDLREREADRNHRREIASNIIAELNHSRSAPKFKVSFRDPSQGSDITAQIQDLKPAVQAGAHAPAGDLTGSLSDGQQVVCKVLQFDRPFLEQWIPRAARIYSLLAQDTLVQGYFGILERENQYYNVWEDLRSLPTLKQWLQNGDISSRVTFLRMTYEISSTMAYFHSVQILLKSLSDETVMVKTNADPVTPVLTEVERARMLVEPSQRASYDVRYEAPEFVAQGRHTKFTDVWSLGVIIRQMLLARSQADKSVKRSPPASGPTQNTSSKSHIIWVKELEEVATSCCARAPLSRPTATEVADLLLSILTREAADSASIAESSDSMDVEVVRFDKISDELKKKKIISDADFIVLARASKKHAFAAYLAGTAILQSSVEVDDVAGYNDEWSQIMDMHVQEKRARRSIFFLQLAVDAGFDDASQELGAAFEILSNLFKSRYTYAMKLTG